MPWQPPTRWEDISSTLDTPLSNEAIRLLNERDQSLQNYLRTANSQAVTFYRTGLADDYASYEMGTILMPGGPSASVTFMCFGTLTNLTPTATNMNGPGVEFLVSGSTVGSNYTNLVPLAGSTGDDYAVLPRDPDLFDPWRNNFYRREYTPGRLMTVMVNMPAGVGAHTFDLRLTAIALVSDQIPS